MIEIIKKIFNREGHDPSSLSGETNLNSIHLATCAILLEIANIDGEFSDDERNKIISVFRNTYNLNEKDVNELIEESGKELNESVDLWKFTSLINRNYSPEQKMKIIETVWMIAYSDGKLTMHEDHLIHKLANLLNLDHKKLIDAKLQVLNRHNKT